MRGRERAADRIRLDTGATAAMQVIALTVAFPLVTVAGVAAYLGLELLVETVTERPVDVWGTVLPAVLLVPFFLLVGAGVPALGGYAMLRSARQATWLHASVLRRRAVLRSRKLDLATADVELERRDRAWTLVARAPGGGSALQVDRIAPGPRGLPPSQLVALADALTRYRPAAGPDDRALEVARRLREIAGGHVRGPERSTAPEAAPGRPPTAVWLSVGTGCAGKAVALLVAVVLPPLGAFLVGFAVTLAHRALTSVTAAVRDVVVDVAFSALVLWGTWVAGLIWWAMLETIRRTAWLEGTLLRERLVVKTTTVDLAGACLATVARGGARNLRAMDPDTGAVVSVPVRGRRSTLPREQLTALADAVTAGLGRTGVDAGASATARGLRELAGEARPGGE